MGFARRDTVCRLMAPPRGLWLTVIELSSHAQQADAGTAGPPEEPALAWFREAKFGLFIHWGLYAVPAGEWKGQPIPAASASGS